MFFLIKHQICQRHDSNFTKIRNFLCLFFVCFVYLSLFLLCVIFFANSLQFRRLQVQEVSLARSPGHPHRPGHQVVRAQSHRLPVRGSRDLFRRRQVLPRPRPVSQDHSWVCDGIRLSQLSPVHHQPLFVRQEVNKLLSRTTLQL